MRTRIAMAIQTPPHAQRLGLVNLLHLIDPSVALDATHAMVHMGLMAEVNVLRQIVNLDPFHRLAGRPAIRGSGSSLSLCVRMLVWQFMQVSVGGIEAKFAFSTVV